MNRSINRMNGEGEEDFQDSQGSDEGNDRLDDREESKTLQDDSSGHFKAGMYIYLSSLQAEAAMKLMPASFTLIEKNKLKKEGIAVPQKPSVTPKKQKKKDMV